MSKIILTQAQQAVLDAVRAQVNAASTTFKPFSVNLTDKEKIGGRRMAEGREGYARLTLAIANQNPNSLSRADNPVELATLLNYYAALGAEIQAAFTFLEMMQETQLGAAADIMVLVDRYVRNLQIDRENNAALDLSMREIDDWNKRFASNKNVTDDDSDDDTTDDDTDADPNAKKNKDDDTEK